MATGKFHTGYTKTEDYSVKKWERPAGWLTMPTITSSDQKFAGIFLVSPYNESKHNLVSFCGAGKVDINWGDGTTETDITLSTGTSKTRTISYASMSSAPYYRHDNEEISVTLNGTTTVTTSSTDFLVPTMLITGTNIPNDTTIVSITDSTTFVISNAATGSGSVTAVITEGYYKQCLVQVSHRTSEANISEFRVQSISTQTTSFNFLSIVVSLPNASTNLLLGIVNQNGSTQFYGSMLKECILVNFSSTLRNTLRGSEYLEYLKLGKDTSSVTEFGSFLSAASRLEYIDGVISLNSATNLNNAFNTCSSLKYIVFAPNTILKGGAGGVTDRSYMFFNCYALVRLYNLVEIQSDTSSVGNSSYLFQNTYCLADYPSIDSSGIVRNAQSMYAYCNVGEVKTKASELKVYSTISTFCRACFRLRKIPKINLMASMSCGNMAQDCRLLEKLEFTADSSGSSLISNILNNAGCKEVIINVSTASSSKQTAFANMKNLEKVEIRGVGVSTTNASYFSLSRSVLRAKIKEETTTSAISFSSYMGTSYYIMTTPLVTITTGVSSSLSMFAGSYKLRRIKVSGINISFSISNCDLDRNALVDLFNSLATVSGQTLTYTANPGNGDLSSADKLIATNKGWTLNPA